MDRCGRHEKRRNGSRFSLKWREPMARGAHPDECIKLTANEQRIALRLWAAAGCLLRPVLSEHGIEFGRPRATNH